MRCAWVSGEGLCLPAGKHGYLWGASLWFSFVSTRRPMTSFPLECSPLRTCMFLHAFFWASVYCYVLVQRLGWTALRPFPSNHGTFFSLSIDRWVGFATPFSSHRTVARRRVSPFLLLPCTSVSTVCRRGSLSLLPSGLRDRNGGRMRSLPRPSSPRFSSALPIQKGRNTRFLFLIGGEGRSRYLRGRFGSMDPVRPVGGGLGEEEARPDPMVEQIRTPSPPKILPRRTTHPRPKQVSQNGGRKGDTRRRYPWRIVIGWKGS